MVVAIGGAILLLANGFRPPLQSSSTDSEPRSTTVVKLRDVARESGLTFVLENHPTPQKHPIEAMLGGVAAFDYNRDGWTDIYFTNGATVPSLQKESPRYFNRLFRNDGGMKFTDVTQEAQVQGRGYSMGVAAGDYDNDGWVDLFVAGVFRNTLYRNLGNGRFHEVTSEARIKSDRWSVAAGWFDYDRDGWLDLLVVNYLDWSPEMDIYCGDSIRRIRTICHPSRFAGLSNNLYRNRGDGTFEDVSQQSGIAAHLGKGMSVAFADFDVDGFTDVFITNDTLPDFLFRNRGDGSFEQVGLLAGVAVGAHGRPVASMGVDFRDYNNDGLPDLAVTALIRETFPIFRNEGKGLFREDSFPSRLGSQTAKKSGWSNGFFDFNNDGWKDLFTANSHVNDLVELFEASPYKQANSIFVNRGDGSFLDVSAEAGPQFQAAKAHRGSAFADFNNDGRMDVVVSVIGERPELWENVTPGTNRWLILKLTGSRGNRDGLGTAVRIGHQHNVMTTSVGYASSSYYGVHFGLGATEWVDRIEIIWPKSRTVQILPRVQANQILEIQELPR